MESAVRRTVKDYSKQSRRNASGVCRHVRRAAYDQSKLAENVVNQECTKQSRLERRVSCHGLVEMVDAHATYVGECSVTAHMGLSQVQDGTCWSEVGGHWVVRASKGKLPLLVLPAKGRLFRMRAPTTKEFITIYTCTSRTAQAGHCETICRLCAIEEVTMFYSIRIPNWPMALERQRCFDSLAERNEWFLHQRPKRRHFDPPVTTGRLTDWQYLGHAPGVAIARDMQPDFLPVRASGIIVKMVLVFTCAGKP